MNLSSLVSISIFLEFWSINQLPPILPPEAGCPFRTDHSQRIFGVPKTATCYQGQDLPSKPSCLPSTRNCSFYSAVQCSLPSLPPPPQTKSCLNITIFSNISKLGILIFFELFRNIQLHQEAVLGECTSTYSPIIF